MSNLLPLRDSCHWLDGLHRCPIPAFFLFLSLERKFQSTGNKEETMAAILIEKDGKWNERSFLERRKRNEFFV